MKSDYSNDDSITNFSWFIWRSKTFKLPFVEIEENQSLVSDEWKNASNWKYTLKNISIIQIMKLFN